MYGILYLYDTGYSSVNARFTPNSRDYLGVGRHGHMFLLCYSPEGHKLHLYTCNNWGSLAIEIDKLHDHF